MNLNFDNVDVNYKGWKYFTYIKSISMLSDSSVQRTARGEVVQAEVNSEYVISKARSYFKKMTLKFVLIRNTEADGLRKDFWWKKMEISGDINIEEFDEFYKNLWSDYQVLSEVHAQKTKILWESEMKTLTYIAKNRDAVIAYQFRDDTLSINFQEGKIVKVKVGDQVFQEDEIWSIEEIFIRFL